MAFALPIAMIATAASAGMTAMGQIVQAQGQSAMYSYQAGVARANALIAERNAQWANVEGVREEQVAGRQTAFQRGQAIATQGAGNLDVNTGTSREVQESITQVGREKEDIISSNAIRRAYGYQVEKAQDVAQAAAYDSAAKTSRTAGFLAAGGSILGGVEGVSSKWVWAQAMGMNPSSMFG